MIEARLRLEYLNERHARVTVFIGPEGSGANCGQLVLDAAEWQGLLTDDVRADALRDQTAEDVTVTIFNRALLGKVPILAFECPQHGVVGFDDVGELLGAPIHKVDCGHTVEPLIRAKDRRPPRPDGDAMEELRTARETLQRLRHPNRDPKPKEHGQALRESREVAGLAVERIDAFLLKRGVL